MGFKTEIAWTDSTWNPWHGCRKVSPGCKYCYMFRDKSRYGLDPEEIQVSGRNITAPTKWEGSKRIFTCSWSDFFIEEADDWREMAWQVIKNTPQHTYQILTKRPERIRDNLPKFYEELNNVWIGVSIESNIYSSRVHYLLDMPVNFKLFISFEPLLELVYWREEFSKVGWIIIGGESGNETGKYLYRPCHINWISSLVHSAYLNDIPCFVKQLGTDFANRNELKDRHGRKLSEWPPGVRVQQIPAL